jgi:uncharacterized protein (TIGR00255 family)
MIKSMTGFGKADCEFQSKRISVEIKSLNSKQLDLNLKIPSIFKEKELDFRNEISKELIRGKVDLYMSIEAANADLPSALNATLIQSYYQQITELSQTMGISMPEDILNTLLRMPDVLKAEKIELSDEEWACIINTTRQALAQVNEFREQEGAALEKDIRERIHLITNLALELEPFETQRVEKIKTKLRSVLAEQVGVENVDKNRFEQELIYYLEKLDITEEKIRLANHCRYFLETMDDSEPGGKKLGFITQEIGREINTIGSKSNDAGMQRIVVKMKDELEKIKEQINNVM